MLVDSSWKRSVLAQRDEAVVGVVSDTHGLLRNEVPTALEGVDLILHAGDVGHPAVLDRLEAIAPVLAVRGNVDRGSDLSRLPLTEAVIVADALLYVIHIREELPLDPISAQIACVIFGHTHQPVIETAQGILWINPGSIGPRRFQLPISLARLTIRQGMIIPELIDLSGKVAESNMG